MAKIIPFPRVAPVKTLAPPVITAPRREGLGWWGGLLLGIWMLVVLLWGVIRWILALDVFWQMCRMAYYWNEPGVYAGWQFLAHFAVFSALHYYVAVYRPRGAPIPASANLAAKRA